MAMAMAQQMLTRTKVMALSVPVMLAQAATASTGVVDTAVMGLYGTKFDLGAVGVAACASMTGTDSAMTLVRVSIC